MVSARRWVAIRVVAIGAVVLAVAGCTGQAAAPSTSRTDAGPEQAISAFALDWQAGRTQDASNLTTDPAAAAGALAAATSELGATRLSIDIGPIGDEGAAPAAPATATVTATLHWTIPDVGTWSYPDTWTWRRSGTEWLLDYGPQVIHPKLGSGQSFAVRIDPATNGPIVDRNDEQLIGPVRVYSVVVLVSEVTDSKATAAKLAAILGKLDPTVTTTAVTKGIDAARRAGEDSYTVTNIREPDFAGVEARLTALGSVSLPSAVRDLAPSAGFASAVLASAAPVAATLTRGAPGWRIITVDAAGDELETLAEKAAKPGPKVELTLDPAVQDAAQHSVDAVTEPAVIVAIQPSTGEILAVAQNAAATADGPIALMGRYPPGSIFKIVTATAAVGSGLIGPTTPVACPGEWTVDHRTIHNEGFSLGTVTATSAFAHSCNTTFAMLAARMAPAALPQAALQYGIGLDFVIPGITTLTGAVQSGATQLERAENGFGQGTDLVTPLGAALMAATAATGNMPTPVLIRGQKTTVDRPAPPRSVAAQQAVRTMMRAVVTDGTAKGLAKDGEVYAKTGTAEYTGADGKIHAHAWTVAFRGDLAFSALIVGGDSSKRTNDLAHTMLAALPGR